MWNAWNSVKSNWKPSKDILANHLSVLLDSFWYGFFASKARAGVIRKAHMCYKGGITAWKDMVENGQLKSIQTPQRDFPISAIDALWCLQRAKYRMGKIEVLAKAVQATSKTPGHFGLLKTLI
ncbi:hypothetical protein GOP47_0023487 [Adiantum capillus-veneris]|uniref:Uncharacterized protein n=1 Tax=Adiantum capillus-veneris TaxID=13818 RepID=A0A9D4Z566_ADICA|nr:hypothetical protein GOP47_0023487 [Adiantum capillus-veneris]